MSAQPLLYLHNVSVAGRLSSVAVRCRPGELVHIIGPNGAGKSTLLALMAGLQPGDGETLLLGQAIADWSARDLARVRAYLPQHHSALALMPVFQYLQLHQPSRCDAESVDKVVEQLAERLSLTDKLRRPLARLSGGEWQRVRLAAVLLQVWPTLNPSARLLLLDEPAASLDIAQRVALDSLLAELCRAGIAVIASGHDLNHTLHHADRVWLMSRGGLMAQGAVADVMQPETLSPVFGVAFTRYALDGRHWMLAQQE
ncbi:vitamin B12 ABC transporter ATP-binding protein BtuD [Dickeya fangzhongdai]|uniref:Vitamin B12 import ATP-binding protein BtuD n=1 Tax=Dickeya fangzhongdai TaxID=1778540 RepID=A0A2K8QQD4_9GAMM|nr:vitamin B12 ABC transporter ATP-binding protein BtuD [Dickeya fangzhongdai]ATZ94940.1 vitamin B12 ABC transporter ATP-binding protein BtuD [Dickeya fangzhongdai]QOH48382.1 vitamin B12 ABC transporter ATP-binding protein BtuD [Dickeya fangzhongdai]QOH52684.1 vitamin B12 ABC transporter ATP-binding protein BtuD [Dickeya fangzhongdai]WOY00114.1 vitamin B12 ABC transporter ATP-binding protein BtuD [Dickeya fangzhongdai]WOY04737.1 vitamin B12 ABC transporter ATP-binding protein BtuD [Dickeya fan